MDSAFPGDGEQHDRLVDEAERVLQRQHPAHHPEHAGERDGQRRDRAEPADPPVHPLLFRRGRPRRRARHATGVEHGRGRVEHLLDRGPLPHRGHERAGLETERVEVRQVEQRPDARGGRIQGRRDDPVAQPGAHRPAPLRAPPSTASGA
ncbi:hypothetical protein N505_0105095 [Rhodococcus aetherivorans]|nr:hypothetical protein N505_0105095 [Rhodococcus aetherivorans]